MARVIKRTDPDAGDISPDTGFAEAPSTKVISSDRYAAKSEAQGIIGRAEQGAEGIRQTAQAQAAEILEAARQEAEQLRAQAREEGYKEGRDQGAAELTEVVASASMRLKQIENQAVPQLKALAVSIARKVLGRELEFHPEGVVDIVRQALSEKARQRREIFLRIHPDDLDIIREQKDDLLEVLSRCKEIGFREDPEVQRYGVIIETDAGVIDAQLETQLQIFERVLKDTP